MTGDDMAPFIRLILSGLILTSGAVAASPDRASAAAPADLHAPPGYRVIAEVDQRGAETIVQGRVCRTAGAASHRPQTVRILALMPGGGEQMLGWTGLSRSVAVRDTGCGFFSYRLRQSLPDAPLRIVAF